MCKMTWFIFLSFSQMNNLDDTYLLTDKCPQFPPLLPLGGVIHH